MGMGDIEETFELVLWHHVGLVEDDGMRARGEKGGGFVYEIKIGANDAHRVLGRV